MSHRNENGLDCCAQEGPAAECTRALATRRLLLLRDQGASAVWSVCRSGALEPGSA